MRKQRVKKSLDLPGVGDILNSSQDVPVYHLFVNGEPRWKTFAIWRDGWELVWEPKRGLVVFLDRKNFKELENHPWCRKVRVVRYIQNSILAEIYE